MRDLDRAGLDRWITGNWGEDQFKDERLYGRDDRYTDQELENYEILDARVEYFCEPDPLQRVFLAAYLCKVADKGLMQALRQVGVL